MTDLEKAKEISIGFSIEKLSTTPIQCCKESALEMAQWKESQMIEKAKEFIAEWFYEHPHTSWLICSDEFQDLDDCLERLEREMKEEQ